MHGESRRLTKGVVARFSLATNEIYKDRNGVMKEETTWHNIAAWATEGMPDFTELKKDVQLTYLHLGKLLIELDSLCHRTILNMKKGSVYTEPLSSF